MAVRRRVLARLFSSAGLVVAALAVLFVVRAIASSWSSTRAAMAGADRWWLALALVLAAGGMAWIGATWRRVVLAIGGSMRPSQAITWYFVGEIAKYIPGGVWPVLGRSELARRSG